MQNHTIQMRNPLNALAGLLLVLGTSAALAQGPHHNGDFDEASLQGSYAYVNNVGGVASFGPMTFNGHGGLTAKIKVNLPCPEAQQVQGCSRNIVDLGEADGTYTVEPDGTGVATINFAGVGATKYDFVVSETTKKGSKLLATQVFAASQTGGLAGQVVAPTWSRTGD